MVFCPKCGKKEVIDVFCSECLRESEPLVKDISKMKTKYCRRCGRIYINHKWIKTKNISKKITDELKNKIKFTDDAIIKKVEIDKIEQEDLEKKNLAVNLLVTGKLKEKMKSYSEDYVVEIRVEKEICSFCSLQNSKYYEGILQLRNPPEKAVEYVLKEAKKQENNKIFITDVIEVKNGIDLYFTDQQYIHALAHNVIKKFGGEMKRQARLFSRDKQKSKNLYRTTILIRFPEFKIGDVIKIKNKIILIEKISKNIFGINLTSGKKTSIDYLHEEFDSLPIFETTVSKVYPQIEIIHPETFQSVTVKNKKKVSIDDKIKVARLEEEFYLI